MSQQEPQSGEEGGIDYTAHAVEELAIPALAALVCRQARRTLFEDRIVAGVDMKPGTPIGLGHEDRKAMALVSRICISRGMRDIGSEIHELLFHCTLPLGAWLPHLLVERRGLSDTVLINEEDGAPTIEAAELAAGFSSVTAGLEELLFSNFRELLEKHPRRESYGYYTAVREFVVRHPVTTSQQIRQFANNLPSTLWMLLQQSFYEPIPFGWSQHDRVTLCGHCGNAMRPASNYLRCRTSACAAASSAMPLPEIDSVGLLRLRRGIHQYWVEPGVDEIRLYDKLRSLNIAAQLYPFMDRVDIAVGDIGIDLKSYASPELLGERIRRDIGGLRHYANKWLVVPDWLIARTAAYLDRLRHAIEGNAARIRCLSATAALNELANA
jgi:hypothetical protein